MLNGYSELSVVNLQQVRWESVIRQSEDAAHFSILGFITFLMRATARATFVSIPLLGTPSILQPVISP